MSITIIYREENKLSTLPNQTEDLPPVKQTGTEDVETEMDEVCVVCIYLYMYNMVTCF